MPTEDQFSAINGDHDPADFASCPACHNPTFQGRIPTAGGPVIVYVCDACDASGPRIFIPHLDRFEARGEIDLYDDQNLFGLLRLVKGARKH